MKKTKVINLFGGPSSGKSTTAAGLFFLMKLRGINCELVTEYAKHCVWSENVKTFDDQFYIAAKQCHKQEILRGKVDYIITDSPVLLGCIYADESYYPAFSELLFQVFNSYDNINFCINRVKPFNPVGRNQKNAEEAIKVDQRINELLSTHIIHRHAVDGDLEAPTKIMDVVFAS